LINVQNDICKDYIYIHTNRLTAKIYISQKVIWYQYIMHP